MAATTMVRLGAPALAVAIPAILVLAALPVLQLGDGTNLPQLALFLGRLHPIGVVLAGLIIALSFVGGEVAQITIKLPFAAVGIFQAMMLFLLLASDVLVRYRVRVVRPGEVPA